MHSSSKYVLIFCHPPPPLGQTWREKILWRLILWGKIEKFPNELISAATPENTRVQSISYTRPPRAYPLWIKSIYTYITHRLFTIEFHGRTGLIDDSKRLWILYKLFPLPYLHHNTLLITIISLYLWRLMWIANNICDYYTRAKSYCNERIRRTTNYYRWLFWFRSLFDFKTSFLRQVGC